jgi:hypothetical protein
VGLKHRGEISLELIERNLGILIQKGSCFIGDPWDPVEKVGWEKGSYWSWGFGSNLLNISKC